MDKIIFILVILAWPVSIGLLTDLFDNGWLGFLFGTITFFFVLYVASNYFSKKDEIKKNAINNYKDYLKRRNFYITYCEEISNLRSVIMLDDVNKKIAFGNFNKHSGEVDGQIINLSDILNMELLENGRSLLQDKKSSELSGTLTSAALGGLIFGGAGAVVAALASQNKTQIEGIILAFQVNDLENPYLLFDFLGGASVGRGSKEHGDIMNTANVWFARIKAASISPSRKFDAPFIPDPNKELDTVI